MLFGRRKNELFQVPQHVVIVVDHLHVYGNIFASARILKTIGRTLAVTAIGQLAGKHIMVVLAVGVLNMGQQLAAFALEMQTAAQQALMPGG